MDFSHLHNPAVLVNSAVFHSSSAMSTTSPKMLTVATAPAKQQSSPLLTLPVELLALVISHASNADLKRLRVASKHLCALSEPQLFQSIVLVSSIALLDKFRCLFERSHLRSYVQRLVYDDRLSSLSDIFGRISPSRRFERVTIHIQKFKFGPSTFASTIR